MDPFIVAFAAAVGAAAGVSLALKYRQRARLADALAMELHSQMTAERMAARIDPVTGMLNRQGFHDVGTRMLSDPELQPLVMVLIGVDNFAFDDRDDYGSHRDGDNRSIGYHPYINHSHTGYDQDKALDQSKPRDHGRTSGGRHDHEVPVARTTGDEVWLAVGRRLTEYAAGHVVARLGSGEYGALITSSTLRDGTRYPDTGELLRMLAEPILVHGRLVRISASVGVTHVDGVSDLGKALNRAESVMRLSARSRSRSRHCRPPVEPPGTAGRRLNLPPLEISPPETEWSR